MIMKSKIYFKFLKFFKKLKLRNEEKTKLSLIRFFLDSWECFTCLEKVNFSKKKDKTSQVPFESENS